MWMLALILVLTLIHPDLLPTFEAGPVTVRMIDAMWLLILTALFCQICVRGSLRVPSELMLVFAPLLPFLLWIGASVVLTLRQGPDQFMLSAFSYARLCVTWIGGFVGGVLLTSYQRLTAFQLTLVGGAVSTVLVATWIAPQEMAEALNSEAIRHAGLIGVNTLGLVSALLALYAMGWPHQRQWRVLRIGLLMMGFLGLALSRSVSSIGAAVIMSAAMLYRTPRWRGPLHPTLGRGILILAMLVIGASSIWLARNRDVQSLLTLEGGSFAQRLALGYAGLLVFTQHPLAGVGWQASASEVMERSELLMAAFPLLPEVYFIAEPGRLSVHNLYIQIVSELGLIGLFLFGRACWRISRYLQRARMTLPQGHPGVQRARWCSLALVLLLLWWNTNPLYGGQTESALAAFLLGSAAAGLRVARQENG